MSRGRDRILLIATALGIVLMAEGVVPLRASQGYHAPALEAVGVPVSADDWLKAHKPAPATDADPPESYQLKPEAEHCDKLYDDIKCEGRVTNISPLPLRRVVALAQCFGKDGVFITSDWMGLDYDPVLPGQTSPFHVLIRFNPAINDCTVSFKYLSGASIPTARPDTPAKNSAPRHKAHRR